MTPHDGWEQWILTGLIPSLLIGAFLLFLIITWPTRPPR